MNDFKDEAVRNLGGELTLEDLREATIAQPTRAGRMTPAKLRDLVNEREGQSYDILDAPAVTLSARHLWDPAARLDVYQPGRWDTTYNLIYMSSDFAPNSASAGYVDFVAPADSVYLASIRFSGHQTSLRVNGPWGVVSASSATTSDHPTVTGVWNGTLGANLHFNFSFTGGIIGYIESIEIYQVS